MKPSSCTLRILTIASLLLLTGCSEKSSEQTQTTNIEPDMPFPLQRMQGEWHSVETNAQCSAVFQGYTVRIRYQNNETEQLHKQNASIDRIDTDRHCLILGGGTGWWPYRFSRVEGTEQLSLEFLTQVGWRRIQLKRKEI